MYIFSSSKEHIIYYLEIKIVNRYNEENSNLYVMYIFRFYILYFLNDIPIYNRVNFIRLILSRLCITINENSILTKPYESKKCMCKDTELHKTLFLLSLFFAFLHKTLLTFAGLHVIIIKKEEIL